MPNEVIKLLLFSMIAVAAFMLLVKPILVIPDDPIQTLLVLARVYLFSYIMHFFSVFQAPD